MPVPPSDSPAPGLLPGPRGALHPLAVGRLGLLVVAVYWLGMFTGTHIPHPPHAAGGINDKFMHFGAFAGLAFLLVGVWSARRGLSPLVFLGVALLLAAYGAIDETTQPWVGRDCELADWCADMIGIVLGLGVFAVATLARRLRANVEPPAVVLRDPSAGDQ